MLVFCSIHIANTCIMYTLLLLTIYFCKHYMHALSHFRIFNFLLFSIHKANLIKHKKKEINTASSRFLFCSMITKLKRSTFGLCYFFVVLKRWYHTKHILTNHAFVPLLFTCKRTKSIGHFLLLLLYFAYRIVCCLHVQTRNRMRVWCISANIITKIR